MPTFTYGHSNSDINEPALEKTATWKRLPCESPINTSPASLISIPFGKFVTFSQPMRRRNLPSSLNTTTQCPLKSQTKYSLPKKIDLIYYAIINIINFIVFVYQQI